MGGDKVFVSAIYVKFNFTERKDLWIVWRTLALLLLIHGALEEILMS